MVTEIRDGVWWIECRGVNAYLLAAADGLTIVDAGTPLDAVRIEVAIQQAGFDLDDVVRVLVTHFDVDHVGAAAKLSVDAPVFVGAQDAAVVTGDRRPAPTGLKGLTQLVTRPFVESVPSDRVRRVDDGDEIGGFTAYLTPGHTPGHVAYVHARRDAAFLGDMVIEQGGELRPAPWYLCDDVDRLRRSIREFDDRAHDFEVAAVGHGVPFNAGGAERFRRLAADL